ncbi:MAG: hypothetical protein IJH20_00740 [Bacilli bacterium]|nr:hypothetical protein [Bacilli bacterium]
MRNRNIKLNVFLSVREHDLLIEKTNKVRLTQSDFIRKLINDYKYESNPQIDIDTIIKSVINDLSKINEYMHRWGYTEFENLLNRDINDLNKLLNEKDNVK